MMCILWERKSCYLCQFCDMFLGLPEPFRIRILLSSSKKNFDSCCLRLPYDFLSLKNDVNVPLLATWMSANLTKIAGSGFVSLRFRSGSVPKCHGSATPKFCAYLYVTWCRKKPGGSLERTSLTISTMVSLRRRGLLTATGREGSFKRHKKFPFGVFTANYQYLFAVCGSFSAPDWSEINIIIL